MLNDLTVTLWFYYLLYFLKEIVGTPAASLVLLVGQAIDGISILVLGPLVDRTVSRFGKF
jgi:Na+/melibiose symporter-like transporter